MAEVVVKTIGLFKYIEETYSLWIVYKCFPTGKIEKVLAFTNEECARKCASGIIGFGEYTVGIEKVTVVKSDWNG